MTDVVEACVCNVDDPPAAEGVELRVHPCLEQCGICYAEPFLVFDGDLETGESHAALLGEHADT